MIAGLAPAVLIMSGCLTTSPELAVSEVAPAASPYSPYVVDLEGVPEFGRISFKDVGLRADGYSPAHAEFQQVAMSLADQLMSVEPAPMSAEVLFLDEYADPSAHQACGQSHIYVDLWRSESPDRLGYSLWSGCDEDAQFAWEEVAMSSWDPNGDLSAQLRPVVSAITRSLEDARATGCFTRTC
jgi:hypothetical protein